MEPITTYTSSDGKQTPITELNAFHLANALVKCAKANDDERMVTALKAEVIRRLVPPTETRSENV